MFPLTAFTWPIQLRHNSFQSLAFLPSCITRWGNLPYRDLSASKYGTPGKEGSATNAHVASTGAGDRAVAWRWGTKHSRLHPGSGCWVQVLQAHGHCTQVPAGDRLSLAFFGLGAWGRAQRLQVLCLLRARSSRPFSMRTPRAAPGPSFLPHPPGANAAHEDAGLCQALCAPPTPCTAPHMGRIVSKDQASQPTLGGKKNLFCQGGEMEK